MTARNSPNKPSNVLDVLNWLFHYIFVRFSFGLAVRNKFLAPCQVLIIVATVLNGETSLLRCYTSSRPNSTNVSLGRNVRLWCVRCRLDEFCTITAECFAILQELIPLLEWNDFTRWVNCLTNHDTNASSWSGKKKKKYKVSLTELFLVLQLRSIWRRLTVVAFFGPSM